MIFHACLRLFSMSRWAVVEAKVETAGALMLKYITSYCFCSVSNVYCSCYGWKYLCNLNRF